MKVGYVVFRFPLVTETFIVREMTAVQGRNGITITLLPLFRGDRTAIHPAAVDWATNARFTSIGSGLAASVRWTLRDPRTALSVWRAIVHDYWRHPRLLAEATGTALVAFSHASVARKERLEHVHAHFAAHPALAAWVIARLCRLPYSFTAHAYDLFVHQYGLARKIRDARFIVAISDYNRQFLVGQGADPSRVVVIRSGIDAAAYAPKAPRAATPRSELECICVAGMKEYKGHRVLIDALTGAADLQQSLHVVLVGDGPLLGELMALVVERGLANRVRFTGKLSENEVRNLLAGADLAVLPSVVDSNGSTEGLPVFLIEAMAAGVPVVATRVTGVPELVRDGETGTLAEPGDPVDLARALRGVSTRYTVALEMAEAARRLVSDEYSLSRQADALATLLGAPTCKPVSPYALTHGGRTRRL